MHHDLELIPYLAVSKVEIDLPHFLQEGECLDDLVPVDDVDRLIEIDGELVHPPHPLDESVEMLYGVVVEVGLPEVEGDDLAVEVGEDK